MKKPRKSTKNIRISSTTPKNNTLDLVDRISDLPDSILGLILSNLPTKNAVATSILSKRWKLAWTNVHNLDFYFEDWFNNLSVVDKYLQFAEIVNRVMLLPDAVPLNKFRLYWAPRYISYLVSTWINTAIRRKVHDLNLFVRSMAKYDYDYEYDYNYAYDDDDGDGFKAVDDFHAVDDYKAFDNFKAFGDLKAFKMPASVHMSDSLQRLELQGDISVSEEAVVCLPRLESIKFDSIFFESEEAFKKLISGCPMLNKLQLEMDIKEMWRHFDDYYGDFTYIISSSSLKSLEIRVYCSESEDYSPPSVQLESSSLEYLKLDGPIAQVFVQGTLSSLVRADIEIEFLKDGYSEDICNSVVEAVRGFNCAEGLTLSPVVMWALTEATISLSTKFRRLKFLEAESFFCYCSSFQDFIQCSDSLEQLNIKQNFDTCDHDDHTKWTAPVKVPRCLSNSLKVVEFIGYAGYNDEREMIRYILQHASVLEFLYIICHAPNKKKLIKVIRSFPRKSPACKIELGS